MVFFASREPKSITLRQILEAKTAQKAATLAYRELPIRYAQRILQIEALPGYQASPELLEVHRLYSENFKDIRLVEPRGDGSYTGGCRRVFHQFSICFSMVFAPFSIIFRPKIGPRGHFEGLASSKGAFKATAGEAERQEARALHGGHRDHQGPHEGGAAKRGTFSSIEAVRHLAFVRKMLYFRSFSVKNGC